MIYIDFHGEKISQLGFGLMRLPLLGGPGDFEGNVDEEKTEALVDHAVKCGINYFDTAWPYHDGKSELIAGRFLKKYPRDSYYLASKYPGHQILREYKPELIFEEQLKKCGVEYFDFYLLHNVYERSMKVYEDPQWGIIDYFLRQKELGRIKYLGFSCHARYDTMEGFVQRHKDSFDFCQIQFNQVDWKLQDAEKKYHILENAGLPMWVMEPLRGGKLVSGPGDADKIFRWIKSFGNTGVVLSGMNTIEQITENAETFSDPSPLTAEEEKEIFAKGEKFKSAVPCTACGYCRKGCPMQLNIPTLINCYNDAKIGGAYCVAMYLSELPEDRQAAACIGCGKCAKICPQGIDIPGVLKTFSQMELVDWDARCAERAKRVYALNKKS